MELLPLGSIVILKGGFKKLIIIGRKIVQGENKEFYDYLGCLYPEGDIGEEYKFIFNNKLFINLSDIVIFIKPGFTNSTFLK